MSTVSWITRDAMDTPASPYAEPAMEMASYILWELSGRKFSGAHSTFEQYECLCTTFSDLPVPYLYKGNMYNRRLEPRALADVCCGSCSPQGGTLRLRGQPVIEVTTVWYEGVELEPTQWALYDHAYLRFTPEIDVCWCIEVAYTYGVAPPAAGQMAATSLANQLVLGAAGSPECRLPERVTSVNRQGVSWTLLDPQDFLSKGKTGLYEVDLFLAACNPERARARPRVFTPDTPRAASQSVAAGVPIQPPPLGPPEPPITRLSASFTTPSLAAGASATGLVPLALSYRLLTFATSRPARVRLYTTEAKRDADVSRAVGTAPTGDHGLIFEFITTSALLGMELSPAVDGYDGEYVPDGNIPYTVTNMDSAAGTVAVNYGWIRTE